MHTLILRGLSRFSLPLTLAAVILLCGGCPAAANAPTSAALTPIYSFNPTDYSRSQSDSNGYGLTGTAPQKLVGSPSGDYFLLTEGGGGNGFGTVLKFQTSTGVSTVLHSFDADGGTEQALLAGAGDILYGTQSNGGAAASGAVFRLAADGSGYAVLHEFSAGDQNGVNADGAYPTGALVQGADGSLYGETQSGGAYGLGEVYALSADGSQLTILHTFGAGTDGAYPADGLLAGPDGFLYGVTGLGGAGGSGTVFRIKPDGTGYALLHEFSATDGNGVNADGAQPAFKPVFGQGGQLYGAVPYGGSGGSGAIYRMAADGTGFAALYGFSSPDGSGVNADGAFPSCALVTDTEGNFYGATWSGGDSGLGTIFGLSADGSVLSSLYALDSGDGTAPALTADRSGVIFGTTADGGANGHGSLFLVSLHRPATHVLWANSNGQASVWDMTAPAPASAALLYGPYPGWTPRTIAEGPDGHVRLLWTHTDGRVSVWNLADADPAASCLIAGPYPDWTGKALAVGPDNAAHLLWDNADGQVSLWNLAEAHPDQTYILAGPYVGWSGTAISIGANNQERLLWNSTDGRMSVWNLTDANPEATCGVYGPYDGWTAKSLAVGPDNAAHLLWDSTGGQVSLWNTAEAHPDQTCLLAGPYAGWSGTAIAIGADNAEHLLWSHDDGRVSLWNLGDFQPDATCQVFGPFSGWTPVSLSAGP